MSQEDLELLRRFYEAFNRGGFDDAVDCVHPEVELYPGIEPPDQDRLYRGRSGVKEFLRAATEVWETVAAEPKEIIETADNRILVIDRWLFRGRDGIEITRELPTAYSFRDGLIARIDGYTDKAKALAAAGLAE